MAKVIRKKQIDKFLKILNEYFVEMNKGNFINIKNKFKELKFLEEPNLNLDEYEYEWECLYYFGDDFEDDIDEIDDLDDDLLADDFEDDIDEKKENEELIENLNEDIINDLINLYLDTLSLDGDIDKSKIKDSIYLSDNPEDKLEYLKDDLVEYTKDFYLNQMYNFIAIESDDEFNSKKTLNEYIVKIIELILYENIERIYKEKNHELFLFNYSNTCQKKNMFCNNISKKNCFYYIKFLIKMLYGINNSQENWIEEGLKSLNSFIDPYRCNRNRLQKDNYKKKQEKIKKVKCLKQEGVKVTDIAKQMGICRKTVYNYLKL